MAYTFEQIFAADPANPSNIAQNAAITIFAPGDVTMTPLTITDPDGQPLANPLTVNANGFGSAFAHATLDRVAWAGGGFTGYFTSYEGIKQVAVDAQAAAEAAASTAGADAAAVADAAVATIIADANTAATNATDAAAAASNSATSAAAAANLVGAPADTAIAAAINGTGATKTALSAAYGRKANMPDDLAFRQIPVVMMHQFTDANQALGVIKDYLAWGYETIFYSQAMEYLRTGDATGMPEKPIVLTDDDGGMSAYTALYPSLQSLGMKCTYFIVPDFVNGTISTPPNGGVFLEPTAFTWANAVEMKASGLVEFQSHTKTHGSMRCLTGAGTFTADLSDDGTGAGADFLAAKAAIEANIPGANVEYNAAPYGVINEAAIASLKAAGCKGNRITMCGRDVHGVYDGSGPTGYLLPSTDPFRVPIADGGNFKYLKRANKYGEADADGNRFENGKFKATQRGTTLATGWTFATGITLPDGASPATGNALRGFGTSAATPIYHTEMIPVGQWGQANLDWWVKATSVPTNGARLAIECYTNYTDTVPVRTLTDPAGYTSSTGWKRMRWAFTGYPDTAWIKVRFEIVGATASSEALWWDVRVRCPKNALASGSPRPIY